jgi:molybdate transport system ATP-binding protein
MRRGENWAILGANGSGKSTLIGLITGENLQVYANDIELFGKPRGTGESIWDIRSRLGTISAEFQIQYRKTITAYQVICSGFFDSIGIYRHCSQSQYEMARQWIGFFRIDHLVERRFDHLSYGQQRMVLLARAMVKSPDLLILDDPCDGLDPVNRERILAVIQRIGAETPTDIIYVTHHGSEVLACVTHLMVLEKGKVTEQGARLT